MAAYNVGRIVANVQASFFPRTMVEAGGLQAIVDDPGSAQNFATPGNLLVLLDALANLTDAVSQPLHRELSFGKLKQKDWEQFQEWRTRLDGYIDAANEAATGDKLEVFKSVTEPLLIGLFPGEQSSRIPDVATPFIFANMVDVTERARAEALSRFFTDIKDNAAELAKGAGEALEQLPGMLKEIGYWALVAILIGLGLAVYVTFKG